MENNKRPILSISLLCSNREETTKKCLDSLKKIMDKVDSELIIVDTGCNEEMQALIREYTDKIVKFKWCKDFSKARNAGLEQATGEWFMYIDDDEWFEDVTEIVDFFNNGEYKNWNSAFYIQRNYRSLTGDAYKDSWVSRMCKRVDGLKFVSSIHEYLEPFYVPTKLISCPAEHYGYIYKSEKEKFDHAKRNITLLLDAIKHDPNNSRWWIHLLQEYVGTNEYQMLHEMALRGLKQLSKKSDFTTNRERGTLYAALLMSDIQLYKYEEAILDYTNAIKDTRNTELCQAYLYTDIARAYYCLERYSEAIEMCNNYLDIYEKYKDNDVVLLEQGSFFVRDVFEPERRNTVYTIIITAELKRENTEPVQKYFDSFGWDDKNTAIPGGFVEAMVTMFWDKEYDKYFTHIAKTLNDRKGICNLFYDQLKLIVDSSSDDRNTKILKIGKIIYQIESDNYYFHYFRIFYALLSGEKEHLQEDYELVLNNVVDFFKFPENVWEGIIEYKDIAENTFLNMSYEKWKKCVDEFCENSNIEELQSRKQYIDKIKSVDDVRYDYFNMKVLEATIVYGKYRNDYQGLRSLLDEYTHATLRFYNYFFRPVAFEGGMEMLSQSCRLAVKLDKAMKSEKEGNPTESVRLLKECIDVFPSLNGAVKQYLEYYADDAKRKLNDKLNNDTADTKNTAEMLVLGEAVKKKIIELSEQGMVEEAETALAQLKVLLPDDEEVKEIEKMIKH